MNAPFPIVSILALSIIIQAAAAVMAFRLIGITGRWTAWSFITAALTLMAVRRVIPLYRLLTGDLTAPPDLVNEVIGLALSMAMAIGIARIAPLFRERKRAEEELRESEQKYRLLLRNIRAAVVVHGPDTRILMSNPMAQELLGLSGEQLLGKAAIDPAWHFLREDGSVMPLEEYPVTRTFADRRPLKDLIVGVRRPDRDAATWVLVNTETTLNEQGEIGKVIVTFVDITRRKQAEQALRRSEERLNEAQRIAHIGHWELDLINNVLLWSDEIYRIFEIDPGRFGASYEAFLNAIHPDDRAAVDAAYTNSVKNKTPYAIEHRLLFADGRVKYVREQSETYYDQDGSPCGPSARFRI